MYLLKQVLTIFICSNRNLEELLINDNRLQELQAIPLQMPSLQIVDISNNHVEDFQQMVRKFLMLNSFLSETM